MTVKKYIRKKLFQLLFGNEIEIGDNTVKIDGNSITLPGLTANPTLATGKIWFRSDTGTILYTPDGTNTKNIAPADWNTLANKPSTFPPSTHKQTHEKDGTDQVQCLELTDFYNFIDKIWGGRFVTSDSVIYYADQSVTAGDYELIKICSGDDILIADWSDRIDLSTKEVLVSSYLLNKERIYDRDTNFSTYANNAAYTPEGEIMIKWDLGSIMDIILFIVAYNKTYGANALVIDYSIDDVNWTKLIDVPPTTKAAYVQRITARYIRWRNPTYIPTADYVELFKAEVYPSRLLKRQGYRSIVKASSSFTRQAVALNPLTQTVDFYWLCYRLL